MSPWKSLSFITALIIFFSGMTPATASSTTKSASLPVITAQLDKAINHPQFACQILWVRIQDQDRELLEQTLTQLGHIDQSGRRISVNSANHFKSITFKISSLMWLPGSAEFKNDYSQLRKITSLEVVGCQIFNQTAKARKT